MPLLITPNAATSTVDAALDANVNPEHVTLTGPAGTSTFTSMTMISVGGLAMIPLLSVTDKVDGFGSRSQLVADSTAVTNLLGKVSMIFPVEATNLEDVLNENVAV